MISTHSNNYTINFSLMKIYYRAKIFVVKNIQIILFKKPPPKPISRKATKCGSKLEARSSKREVWFRERNEVPLPKHHALLCVLARSVGFGFGKSASCNERNIVWFSTASCGGGNPLRAMNETKFGQRDIVK